MPRQARFTLAGVPEHVIQRGHNRAASFFEPLDHTFWLEQLARHAGRFDCALRLLPDDEVAAMLGRRVTRGMPERPPAAGDSGDRQRSLFGEGLGGGTEG